MQATATEGQLPLLGPHLKPIVPIKAKRLSIDERFRLFHAANPQVYAALRDMALALVAQGHQHFGIKMLWETLRCGYMRTTGEDGYLLNNVLTSRYARELMECEPALAGVFETRELRS